MSAMGGKARPAAGRQGQLAGRCPPEFGRVAHGPTKVGARPTGLK